MDAAPILETRGVSVRFGDFTALSGVDLSVRPFNVHSIIGPNGAGKTTFFNVLSGSVKPTGGTIHFDGRNVTAVPAHKRVSLGMSRSFQVTNLFQNLTVAENIRLAAQAPHRRAMSLWGGVVGLPEALSTTDDILDRLDLRGKAAAKAGDLSHGEQRLLEVGLAMASDARLIFLDEPTSGMGINDIGSVKRLIEELAKTRTVLLIEHNMSIVLDISDRVTVLHQGRVLVEGTPDQVRDDPLVRSAYLGEPH